MCIVCIANNINRNVYLYLNTRIFPTTGYARVLLFMFIRRELGGTGTGCLFQFTYCDKYIYKHTHIYTHIRNGKMKRMIILGKDGIVLDTDLHKKGYSIIVVLLS